VQVYAAPQATVLITTRQFRCRDQWCIEAVSS